MNPSTQARVDRMRTAPVDCVTIDAPFAAFASGETLIQPIDTSRIASGASCIRCCARGGRRRTRRSVSAPTRGG
ncbi:hypothetical protein ACFQU2_06315 [Siccirubricoccus deserti]